MSEAHKKVDEKIGARILCNQLGEATNTRWFANRMHGLIVYWCCDGSSQSVWSDWRAINNIWSITIESSLLAATAIVERLQPTPKAECVIFRK